jgi:hypothetical protein
VASVNSEFWFNTNKSKSILMLEIVFYLYPLQLSASEIDNMVTNQDYVTYLFNTYYSHLVPVRYTRKSSHPIIVNHFEIVFRVDINRGQQIEIVTADIIGSYDDSIAQPYANVAVKVEYIRLHESLAYYNAGIGYYFIFAVAVALLMMAPLRLTHIYLGSIHIG